MSEMVKRGTTDMAMEVLAEWVNKHGEQREISALNYITVEIERLRTELSVLDDDIDALRQRVRLAETAIDSYARLCGWDNHCKYWVAPNGFVKVQIRSSTFYRFPAEIGQAVIAIRARHAVAAAKEE
jgi:hypothetical protein